MKRFLFITIILISTSCSGLQLVKTSDRPLDNTKLSLQEKTYIKANTIGLSAYEIIDFSIKYSADKLKFTKKNDLPNYKANCVGYAKYCAAVCNYAATVNNINLKAKPVVGYVYYYSINLCSVLRAIVPEQYKNFVKDHDFVEFRIGSKIIYGDPSLYDIIGTAGYITKHV